MDLCSQSLDSRHPDSITGFLQHFGHPQLSKLEQPSAWLILFG